MLSQLSKSNFQMLETNACRVAFQTLAENDLQNAAGLSSFRESNTHCCDFDCAVCWCRSKVVASLSQLCSSLAHIVAIMDNAGRAADLLERLKDSR